MGSVLQFPGRVVASSEVNVSFRVAGPLRRVYAQEGKHVSAGQLLAEIDPTDYQVQLSATEAEYAQVKAEAERVMALYEENGTTASNYDKARYGLQQIEAKLKNHRNQVAYTRIYAPFSGVVQKCYFEGGETVAAGMPIVSILSAGKLEVEVNLPAVSYTHMDEFQSYSCTFDVLPGHELPLQFINVLPKANTNQLYTLRLRLNAQGEQLAPGMSAWVTIHTSNKGEQQMRVPTTSIVDEGGQSFVYLYSDGKAHRASVKVESLHTDGTATVTGALHPGDAIITSGAHHLSDGISVEPLMPVSETNIGGML
jgi:RND family efflux transporter MFP subunit